MKSARLAAAIALAAGVAVAQNTAVFPSEYAAVAAGPNSSPNLPLAYGTSRVMVVYNRLDLAIPNGASIVKLGFREDTETTTMNQGRGLQLEVRMGWTANDETNASHQFDVNYASPPTTVFGPALYTLPNLRDPGNPLPNGRFSITLATPFVYAPGANNLVVEYRVFGTSGGGAQFTYFLDRADYHSPVVDGPPGCLHFGGGPPVLRLLPVQTNAWFTANVSAAPANSLAILVMSVGSQLVAPYGLQALVPGIDPSCTGQVSVAGAATVTAVTNSAGALQSYFLVPNFPSLYNDLFISCQGAFFDFFAPGGVVVSNGSQVQIGIPPRTRIIYAQGPPSTTASGSVFNNYCPVAFFEHQ
jgi:hypothetical protein